MAVELPNLAEQLRALDMSRTPPMILLTRWQALLGDDQPIYFDAAHEAGGDVPGSRYSFFAVTTTAVCYLKAEHDDDMWEHDRHVGRTASEITPRALVAWRRPIGVIEEVRLAGSSWDWLADESVTSAVSPVYRLRIGDDEVELPLPSKYREGRRPDVAPLFERLREVWGS